MHFITAQRSSLTWKKHCARGRQERGNRSRPFGSNTSLPSSFIFPFFLSSFLSFFLFKFVFGGGGGGGEDLKFINMNKFLIFCRCLVHLFHFLLFLLWPPFLRQRSRPLGPSPRPVPSARPLGRLPRPRRFLGRYPRKNNQKNNQRQPQHDFFSSSSYSSSSSSSSSSSIILQFF